MQIDFSEPEWLILYYDLIGAISIVLNAIGIYLLIFKSLRLGTFRFYFLTFQILSALSDIHLTIFMKPIPLTPLFAGYTVGIMPKNLDISAHHCAILTGFIAVSQLETLILCFARMHQVIALVLNTHVVPKFLQYSCYALCVLCPIALCGLLSEMFIAWFVSHSSINMIGLIIFFPPYQIFFLRVFKRKNSKHTTPVAVVPVVAAVSSGF
ncbi:hypothetical protein L3Y34_019215 [Caenorhabditis briggsae]|uniref:G protein-coupled receptor n=1 Tax=Caenorhabditis briggsae TaxID=6238 RepID=A0AAE9DPB4_CAEBR|nr:hypothetical protein L3Y34_019215 [Caenorhabditis briggsae]